MNKALETLTREMNPKHDFYRVGKINALLELWDRGDYMGLSVQTAVATVNIAKHFVRGAFYGAAAGAALCLLSGSPVLESAETGAEWGALIDGAQYAYRGAIHHYIKAAADGTGSLIDYLRKDISDS